MEQDGVSERQVETERYVTKLSIEMPTNRSSVSEPHTTGMAGVSVGAFRVSRDDFPREDMIWSVSRVAFEGTGFRVDHVAPD